MKMRWLLGLGLAAGLGVLATGCAQEREPINRVQSMALKKSFFLGESLADQADNPEFYTQQFITDVPYGVGSGYLWTVGFGGKVARVKFEATEDFLIARITYQRIDDSDGKGVDPHKRDGIIAAMFPIISHFDIRRSYNPQTGEEMNVIEENQSDRPWYEREYFRVDWSQNLNTDSYDFDVLSDLGLFGGTKYEPIKYQVTDPSAPDAPHFSVDDGYFDITTKAFAAPQVIDISHMGWGINEIPSCMLEADFFNGSAPAGSCNPIEITLRLSFKKVVDTDYEPQNWDGYRFAAYGAFYTDRYGYSSDYGMVDDKWRRFIDRYNIWERSHYYADPVAMTGEVPCNTLATTGVGGDPHRDVKNADNTDGSNGTEDECEAVTQLTGVAGSRCDEFKHKCTLPFRARKAKEIAWYYTNSDPQVEEYFEPTGWAAHEWDVALRSAVQTARYAECVRTGGENCAATFPVFRGQAQDNDDAVAIAREVDMCNANAGYPAQLPAQCSQLADDLAAKRLAGVGVADVAKLPEMLTLCHSPVRMGDSPACGELGTTARLGDLRYHGVNVLPNPQTPSPWGIMVDSIDPTSGETIMASINCFSFVNDLWSQGVVDYVRYINGELSTADITEGTNVRNWVQADRLAHGAGSGGGVMPQLTSDQRIEQLAAVANVDVETMKNVVANREQFHKLPIYNQIKQYTQRINNDIESVQGAPSAQRAIVEARLNSARGTEFEAKLMSTPVLQRAGMFNSSVPLNGTTTDYVSPLRMNNPQFELEWHRMVDTALAKRGVCIMNEAPEGTGITALADMLKWKFPAAEGGENPTQTYERNERMRTYLKKKAHYAVIVHEMGHSIGLRHNFVSSYDAFSFHPQYWQLRTRDGADLPECKQLTNDGNSCTGPRYYDPVTSEENDGVITMWMHDSVMDYAGTTEGDLIGLGVYDFAAARMFYGETVAVADRDDIRVDSAIGGGLLDKMDNFGGIIGIQPSIVKSGATEVFHYSQYQKNFKMISDCQEIPDINAFIPSDWRDQEFGPWHPTVDGRIVRVNGKYTKCKEIPVDQVFYKDLRFPTTKEQAPLGFYRGGPSVDPVNRVRMPYGFATDSWADLGNLSVYRHDIGADPYELFQFFITQQETRHIWDNYRRGRQAFSVRNASNRAFERYNAKMRDGAKGLGLYATLYRNFSNAQGYDYNTLWPYIVADSFGDNVLASGMAFDHFARELQRPHIGDHYAGAASTGGIYLAADDSEGQSGVGDRHMFIPNGATGFFRDVGIGGRPVNNTLSDNHGEYDRDYTLNAGSYYSKINAPILLCESVDNFISSSRNDFVDPRYRAVSVADLFPDGFRRLVANALTMDTFITGERVAANAQGLPILDMQNYPTRPMGWTSWWPKEGPKVCMPADGTTACYSMGNQTGLQPYQPEGFAVVEPQIGWEQQKHLIAQMLLYLPENSMQKWLEMMTIYELGVDADPGQDNRLEFHNPISGKTYIAHTYGEESIFGRDGLQKGIAARMLQYANQLVAAGFKLETDPTKVAPDNNGDGQPDWPTVKHHPDGFPVIIADNKQIGPTGALEALKQCDRSLPATDPDYDPTCREIQCEESKACVKLQRYIETIFFMRQAIRAYGLENIEKKGVYD